MNRYTAVYGFNTHQWWVYDEEEDVYIDIPSEVLNEISAQNDEEEYLNNLLATEPDWLQDTDYWYGDEDFEI